VKPSDNLQLSSSFAVGEESESFGAGAGAFSAPPAEIVAPLDRTAAVVRRGDSVRIDVVARTRTVGIFSQAAPWTRLMCGLNCRAIDNKGKLFSGAGRRRTVGKGPVEAGAHMYRSYLLDEHGNPINKRNAWAARSVLYVRLIPPGAADTVHFRLRVPKPPEIALFLKPSSTIASLHGGIPSGLTPGFGIRNRELRAGQGPR
jgi:hypothetical protein